MRFSAILTATFLAMMCGCSGGGGSSTQPRAAITPGGAGVAAVFNQHLTFVITVPAASAAAAAVRRANAIRTLAASPLPSATPAATTPYVSPLTGSVALTLAEINGVSPQEAPPVIAPIDVPASCQGSSAGCTIPVANVPAALGVDRYYVATYTGPNATGTLISSGFVDVSVPAKAGASTAIGGTAALSIGGFVASIILSPASLNFVQGTAGDANDVLVQGLDAAGATIVGAAQFVTPITVTLTDTKNFTIGGASSYVVTGPLAKPLILHYGGGVSASGGTLIQAASTNGSATTVTAVPIVANVLPPGTTVTATPPPLPGTSAVPTAIPTAGPTAIPTAIPTSLPTARPTPKPSPTQRPTQAMSLYVADGSADTISEYRIASQLAAGTVPNPAATPSRVIKFNPADVRPGAVGNAGLSCFSGPSGSGNGTAGVAVDPTVGSIYLLTNCTDGTNGYVFGYPPQAAGSVEPTIYDPFAGGGFGASAGLATTNADVYAGYNETGASLGVLGFPLASNEKQPTISIGTQCYAEFGNPSPGCFNTDTGGFGIDRNGFLYIPGYWNDTPNGDAATFSQPAAVLAVQAAAGNATLTPYSALAGLNSNAGGSSEGPLAATVDPTTSTLYVLTGSATLFPAVSTDNSYFPGLSACPPPSASAPVNEIVPGNGNGSTQCADGQQHLYISAYSLTSQLLGISAFGNDVDVIPNFLIGGDTTGRFGCDLTPGQLLGTSGGYVYVINLTSSTCVDANGNGIVAPEIDVYNTNGISGAHTDIAPVFVLPLQTSFPLAITIAPSGTVTGGQAWLRAPLSRAYRPNLFGRRRAAQRTLHHLRARPRQ